jgi:hypothetical protein
MSDEPRSGKSAKVWRYIAAPVKATGVRGNACWLSAANEDGFRTLATQKDAGAFQTVADAHAAIAKLPRAFEDVGLIFSVESAE